MAPFNRIQIDDFEGPLDLLLHLIQKNELDITTISLRAITTQYLSHLELIQELNIDMASDFLVIAAELARLKSRSLLPNEETTEDSEGEELLDEGSLVKRLLEYQRFKRAAETLGSRPLLEIDLFKRSALGSDLPPINPADIPIQPEEPGKLVFLYKEILKRRGADFRHLVAMEKISVREKMIELLDWFREANLCDLSALIAREGTRSRKIGAFLAILELLRMRLLLLAQSGDRPSGEWTLRRSRLESESLHAYQEDFRS